VSLATKDAPRPRTSSEDKLVKPFTIRCIVWHEGGAYLAECIDLDIAVRGKSECDVQQKLMDALKSYLSVAMTGDTEGLVPRRPAPLLRRLRYHMLVALAAIISTARRSFRLMELSSELNYRCL